LLETLTATKLQAFFCAFYSFTKIKELFAFFPKIDQNFFKQINAFFPVIALLY